MSAFFTNDFIAELSAAPTMMDGATGQDGALP